MLNRDFQNDVCMFSIPSTTMVRTFYLRLTILRWVGFKYIHHGRDIISFFQYLMVGGIYKLSPWAGHYIFLSLFNGG